MKVCNVAGCPELHTHQSGRCEQHRREARARRTGNRVYSSAGHIRFRNAVLQRDLICTACHRAQATVADHYPISREDLVAQGLNPNDPTRGRGLCHTCHSIETARYQPGGFAA